MSGKQIQKLKQDAKKTARTHGHSLTNFTATSSRNFNAHCQDCGAWCVVNPNPYAGEALISGEAVNKSCLRPGGRSAFSASELATARWKK